MGYSLVVIDDEIDFLESVRRGLITSGIKKVHLEADPRNAASLFEQGETFDVALIDITMPGIDGIELIETIKATSPDTECIMVTAVDEARTAVECMKKGAYDYLVKPISKEDLVLSVNRALERKRLVDLLSISKRKTPPQLINKEAFEPIITGSKDVLRVLKEAELHAPSDIPVLITGETGTGKELLAKAIHAASSKAKYPFTPVNMESLPSNLFDAQFFGHTKGAFTGAENAHEGYLEGANRGTLFLDEIGNLPPEHQGKLLRVLQDGEYIKIGTNRPRKADVRFIAATNADLEKLVIKKAFRKDLYYRLRGGWLHLPSLRERRDDIPLLINLFIEDSGGLHGESIQEEALSLLLDYDYPGNIRELKAIIQSAVNLAEGAPISPKSLPEYLQKPVSRLTQRSTSESIPPLAEVEKSHILEVYDRMDKNKSQTARALAIGLNTLRRKLESYGIE